MNQTTRKIALASTVAMIVFVASVFAYYWFSQSQQLKRACWNTTQASLVSPSSSRLVDFRLESNSSATSPIAVKINKRLQQATVTMEDADRANDEAQLTVSELMKKITSRDLGSENALMEKWREAMRVSDQTKATANQTANAQNMIKNELRRYKESGLPEIVIEFDSQNRAGALVRSEAVCLYSPGPNETQSVQLAQIESR